MISVKIELTGDKKALEQLDRIKQTTSKFEPEMQKAGDYYLDFLINEVFVSQGNVFGEGWVDLSMPYAYRKFKKWGGQLLLVASGKMRNSWKLYTAADSFTVQNEATSKDGAYYAGAHQDGTESMPRRVLLKFDDTRLKKIRDIIVDSLNSRIRGAL